MPCIGGQAISSQIGFKKTASEAPLMPRAVADSVLLSHRAKVALDAARVTASLYVPFYHVALRWELPPGAGIFLRFGQSAVILFFLLSGFVIFANECHRAIHPRGYFLRRLRRIYPPVLVAYLLSAVVAFDTGSLRAQFSWRELFFNLLMLQDVRGTKPGVIADSFLGNGPLWTLSYEAAFYLLFPFALAAWSRKPHLTTHLVGLICALSFACYIAQPNHFTLVASYFQIWWCGAMVAAAYGEGKRSWLAVRVPLGWLCVLVAEAVWVSSTQPYDGVNSYPVLMLQHFALALIMIVGLFGPIGKALSRVLEPLERFWAGDVTP